MGCGPPDFVAIAQLRLQVGFRLGFRLALSLSRGEPLHDFVTQRVHRSGTLLHVSATYSPLRDASGTVVGMSTIVRDRFQDAIAKKMGWDMKRVVVVNGDMTAAKCGVSAAQALKRLKAAAQEISAIPAGQ